MVKVFLPHILIILNLLLFSVAEINGSDSTFSQISYSDFRLKQNNFESKDGNIKYIDGGKGSVILLLHGIPSSGWLYRKMMDNLISHGHRVIAPDMLGFGNSGSPKGYDLYSGTNHAMRIVELMNHLNINNWHHVMHDAGGIWTWELFKIAPSKITKLTILNSVILQEGFNPPIKMKAGFFAKLSMWIYRIGLPRKILLKQLFKAGLHDTTLTESDKEGYNKPLKEGKTKGMYYFFTQTCNALPDYTKVFENITISVQIIWGKYDEMLLWNPQSEQVGKELSINKSNVHILEAKHFIQEEKPNEICSIILAL